MYVHYGDLGHVSKRLQGLSWQSWLKDMITTSLSLHCKHCAASILHPTFRRIQLMYQTIDYIDQPGICHQCVRIARPSSQRLALVSPAGFIGFTLACH